jgi:phage gpG-like protein
MAALKNGLNQLINNLPKFKAAFKNLSSKEVLVGIPSEATERDGSEPITNAELGYIHEHGSPEMNIRARPFLAVGVRLVKPKIAKQFKTSAQRVLKSGKDDNDVGLNRVGMIAQNSVRKTINDGTGFEALSDKTLKARRKRGRTGIKPLIDTGQLRNSITYVIRKK